MPAISGKVCQDLTHKKNSYEISQRRSDCSWSEGWDLPTLGGLSTICETFVWIVGTTVVTLGATPLRCMHRWPEPPNMFPVYPCLSLPHATQIQRHRLLPCWCIKCGLLIQHLDLWEEEKDFRYRWTNSHCKQKLTPHTTLVVGFTRLLNRGYSHLVPHKGWCNGECSPHNTVSEPTWENLQMFSF
jgi:hypothetical protein